MIRPFCRSHIESQCESTEEKNGIAVRSDFFEIPMPHEEFIKLCADAENKIKLVQYDSCDLQIKRAEQSKARNFEQKMEKKKHTKIVKENTFHDHLEVATTKNNCSFDERMKKKTVNWYVFIICVCAFFSTSFKQINNNGRRWK